LSSPKSLTNKKKIRVSFQVDIRLRNRFDNFAVVVVIPNESGGGGARARVV